MKQVPRHLYHDFVAKSSEVPEQKLRGYFTSCRNIKTISRPGQPVRYVPCGKCVECLSKKQSNYVDLIKKEHLSNQYTYYFTLTYDELHVPILSVDISKTETPLGVTSIDRYAYDVSLIDVTHRKKTSYVKNRKTKQYDTIIEDDFFDDYEQVKASFRLSPSQMPNFKSFLRKGVPNKGLYDFNKIDIYHKNLPIIRYIRHEDIKNFLKRVRFHADKQFSAQLRYYGVSEYGPQTFRPHFHFLFFFNSPDLAKGIGQIVDKCWRYGEVRRPSFVEKSDKCASYVAGYLNSFFTLPDYLRFSEIRPKSYHSQYLGCGFNREIARLVYENRGREFEKFDVVCANATITYTPTPQMQNYLFPRIYGYDRHNLDTLFTLYCSYERFSHKFKTDKVSSICEFLLSSPSEHYNFFNALDMKDVNSPFYVDIPPDFDKNNENHLFAFNRLSSVLYCSKRFYKICRMLDWSPYVVFMRIVNHYIESSSRSIESMHIAMERYLSLYMPHVHDDDISVMDVPYIYSLFYYNKRGNEEVRKSTTFINMYYLENLEKARNRIKKKEHNDANQIFVNVLPKYVLPSKNQLIYGKKQTFSRVEFDS